MANKSLDYITSLLQKGIRFDERSLEAYREPIVVERVISPRSSEGSARVKIAGTEVVAGVKLSVGEPYPDTPDEGSIVVNVELIPLASPEFETGPPDVAAVELSRVVDRAIRESGALDMKKLCVKSGEKIWMVFIDIYPLNDNGNLFDACALASIAALQDAKFPKYYAKTGIVDYSSSSNKGLPIVRLPISCTVLKVGQQYLVDPSFEEEQALDARLTIAVADGKICAMQKGGDGALTFEDIQKMVDIAFRSTELLRRKLE